MELFKLHVENLGRIKQAELSIRPLTVFVGPNNTNKTWTAYALYGLARWLSWDYARSRLYAKSGLAPHVKLDQRLEKVVEHAVQERGQILTGTGKDAEDTSVAVRIHRQETVQQLTYPVRIWLNPARLGRLVGISYKHAQTSDVFVEFNQSQLSTAPVDAISFRFDEPSVGVSSLAVTRGSQVGRYRATGIRDAEFVHAALRMGVESVLLGRFEHVYAIPAERKALVTVGTLLPEEARRLLSDPVGDFLWLLQNGMAMLEQSEDLTEVPDAVSLLEAKLLAGSVKTDGARLLYQPDEGPTLTMQAASSLVRALAGLYLCLRCMAKPGDLIVIDEPEMNAHPEAQLMIAELLGILVNKGINVVITTHSPYIVDHINNLTEAAQLCEEKQERIAGRFKLATKEAFVPVENVATYLFEDTGDVKDVFNRETRIIDWSTFGKPSDLVANLYSDILELAAKE